jgi:hypothetical protein
MYIIYILDKNNNRFKLRYQIGGFKKMIYGIVLHGKKDEISKHVEAMTAIAPTVAYKYRYTAGVTSTFPMMNDCVLSYYFTDDECVFNILEDNRPESWYGSYSKGIIYTLDFNEDELEIDDLSEGIDYSIDIEIQMLEEDFFELEKEFSDYTKLEEKNIIKLDNKTEKHREIIKASIKLAFQKKDPLSVKYRKAANQKRSLADKIYAKYGAIARTLVNK